VCVHKVGEVSIDRLGGVCSYGRACVHRVGCVRA